MNIGFPFSIGPLGRVKTVDHDTYVRSLIAQVVLTSPGERVNRPNFGSDVQGLVFEDETNEYFSATRSLLQAALHQWLGDVITVESVHISTAEGEVVVTVNYVDRLSSQSLSAEVRVGT